MASGRTKKSWTIAMLVAAALVASACNNGGNSAKESAGGASSPAAAPSGGSGSPSASPSEPDGPLRGYSPEITVTTVRSVNPDTKDAPGMTLDDNVWTKAFEQDLGIKLKNEWVVTDQQYSDKLTVSMVANNLPDFYMVNSQQFATLIKAGQILDLTDLYQKYASDRVKKTLERNDKAGIKASTVNGKLMGIPNGAGGGLDNLQMLWIRNDWLQKLGLQPPQTMDDVIAIAKAFADKDPDGDKKKNTIGLGIDNELLSGFFSLTGFFNGYHAYPNNPGKGDGTQLVFLKDDQGNPVWADSLPEMKTALAKLNELYAAGALDPEFNSVDGGKAGDQTTQGKIGMFIGQWQQATWPINNMKQNDPAVDWQAYPIPSADDQPVKLLSPGGVTSKFWVINKKAEHPEAVFKLLNDFMEKLYGPNADENFHQIVTDGATYQVFNYSPITAFEGSNVQDNADIQAALKSGDASQLTPAAQVYWKGIQAYEDGKGDLSQWMWNAVFGANGAFNLLADYLDKGEYVKSEYYGSPTPTMISKGGALRDLELQTITKIIMGVQPVDSWDEFVANWHKQGGDQILQEVKDSGMFGG